MNFNGLSLFSSAGIAETYFENHGIHIRVACELLPERAKLYSHLYPSVQMFCGDITEKRTFEAVISAAKNEKCDFLLATPPCQGMSSAGKKDKNDPRNLLIIPAVNAILELKPKFAIIENVPELLTTYILAEGKSILISDYICEKLSRFYHINQHKIVNSMNYGVPQSRERCVYLLSAKDQNFKWEFPKEYERIITMRDAIGDLPSLDPNVTDATQEEINRLFPNYEQKRLAGLMVSPWHYPPKHKLRHVIAMIHTPEGCSAWSNLVYYPTLKNGKKSKGYKNTYKRQWWDRPAYTITKYTSRLGSQENGHPGRLIYDDGTEEGRIYSDPRTMTIFELIRLSSLPDNWNVPLDTSSNLLREIIGEGVPPRLLEAAIIELERHIDE